MRSGFVILSVSIYSVSTSLKKSSALKSWIRLHFLKRSPVWWANFGGASRALAQIIPNSSRPCVVISLPRSGSSWVGSVLSFAKNSAYLREPLTQTYLRTFGSNSRSFFEIDSDKIPEVYKESSDYALNGIPVFSDDIIPQPFQWTLRRRHRTKVFIKEVNPFLIDWFIRDYSPKIIYLLRHPAAVAGSFYKKGWSGEQFHSRLSEKTLQEYSVYIDLSKTFWSDFGLLQAIVLKSSLEILQDYKDSMVVRYEDICINPVDQFRQLFDFCGFEWEAGLQEKILNMSNPMKIQTGDSEGNVRNSLEMINKWRSEIPGDNIEEIKTAYLSQNPAVYKINEW